MKDPTFRRPQRLLAAVAIWPAFTSRPAFADLRINTALARRRAVARIAFTFISHFNLHWLCGWSSCISCD